MSSRVVVVIMSDPVAAVSVRTGDRDRLAILCRKGVR
jgi:hypothetical protein